MKERRRWGRSRVETRLGERLSLTVDGYPVSILKVRDVSPFGIALLIDGHVDSGRNIRLRYSHGVSDIEVCGTVVWSSMAESESQQTWVGIYFHEHEAPLNAELFKTILAIAES